MMYPDYKPVCGSVMITLDVVATFYFRLQGYGYEQCTCEMELQESTWKHT